MSTAPINDGKHILFIVETTTCQKHEADKGDPCYKLEVDSAVNDVFNWGVCGSRIRRAGFTGVITSTSYQTTKSARKVKA
jgi:hypothetical protein